MTAEQFRSDKELVARMRAILEMDVMQLAMEVLAEEAPVNYPPTPDVTPTFATIQLGQQTGWAQYPNRLKTLGTHPPIPKESNPETEYEPDQEH